MLNKLFAREVYIRLADDQMGFVCTVKRGKFYSKAIEFLFRPSPALAVLDDKAPILARRRPAHWIAPEEP